MDEYKNGLVEFKNVYKVFDDKEILHDVSFKINKGKIIGLLGKNGMGKRWSNISSKHRWFYI